ncbi:MAG: hypothetical protein ACK4EX_02445 [Thermaurantimonas sp.]|uniref:hypothetical protein n=1 Tax=Thermaurantimonas TaxID=2681566 RepID=UPI0023F00F39|nr:hypothetical protein [Thermaurantimonas aggregans]MCX8149215.1 hypothetical protein [Thermaurantimonas aggregans]
MKPLLFIISFTVLAGLLTVTCSSTKHQVSIPEVVFVPGASYSTEIPVERLIPGDSFFFYDQENSVKIHMQVDSNRLLKITADCPDAEVAVEKEIEFIEIPKYHNPLSTIIVGLLIGVVVGIALRTLR